MDRPGIYQDSAGSRINLHVRGKNDVVDGSAEQDVVGIGSGREFESRPPIIRFDREPINLQGLGRRTRDSNEKDESK